MAGGFISRCVHAILLGFGHIANVIERGRELYGSIAGRRHADLRERCKQSMASGHNRRRRDTRILQILQLGISTGPGLCIYHQA